MFCVQGTLFKVHKVYFSRDPTSMFRDMFNITQGGSATPTDLEPIPLTDDTVEEFRALCWVVYALPRDIYLQSTREADVDRLAKIVKMCHKYSVTAFETWALEMLHKQCGRELNYLAKCSSDMLTTLMGLTLRCSDDQLLSLVESNWLTRIRDGLPCQTALIVGQRHGRRRFLAEVYFHLSKQLYESTLSRQSAFSPWNIPDIHLLRVLSGHALLLNFWCRLRRDPIPISSICNTSTHNMCRTLWDTRVPWGTFEAIYASGIRGALLSMQTHCRGFDSTSCLRTHIGAVLEVFDPVDYFLPLEALPAQGPALGI